MPTLQALHHCDHTGVPSPYPGYSGFREFDETDQLNHVIAEAAVARVLYALYVIRGYYNSQALSLAKANMPEDQYHEYRRLQT